MTKLRKTVSAALAVAVLAGTGVSVFNSANAAPMIRAAAVETQAADIVQVGFHKKHHGHGWNRHGWRHYGGYSNGYYGRNCFFKKRKVWDEYYGGYFYKRIRVCY